MIEINYDNGIIINNEKVLDKAKPISTLEKSIAECISLCLIDNFSKDNVSLENLGHIELRISNGILNIDITNYNASDRNRLHKSIDECYIARLLKLSKVVNFKNEKR